MVKAIRKPKDETPDDVPWTHEVAERRMRELLASLPPPVPIAELARQQGVRLPQRLEDIIPTWPEGEWDDDEDFDVIREQWRDEQLALEKERYDRIFGDEEAT